jgi:RHS repeat-associated protein
MDKICILMKVDRIVDGVRKEYISYHYDTKDKLTAIVDHLAGKVITYEYNEDGSLSCERNGDVKTITDRNADGAAEKVRYIISEAGEQVYRNVYDDDGKLSEIILPNDEKEKIEYDDFGRVIGIEHPRHNERIVYYQNGDNATNIISSVYQNGDRTKYKYDENGNIAEIRENNKLVSRYGYDGLGRLIREDNVRLGKTFTFDHDTNGNILFKNVYKLTFNKYLREYPDDLLSGLELPAGTESRYVYAMNGNRDRLLSYNNEACAYDELGNPFVYRNRNLEWSHLGSLVKYNEIAFAYDASGLRIGKTKGDNKTKFYWSGDKLIAEKRMLVSEDIGFADLMPGDHPNVCNAGCTDKCETHKAFANASVIDIEYIQGADGLTGFVISGNNAAEKRTYYYRKNIQGDITHITDDDGIVKAEYVYDAWGNHVIVKNDDNIGTINPFRYRGYYFDVETNFYYLKSRYYDPETGRFVNANDI